MILFGISAAHTPSGPALQPRIRGTGSGNTLAALTRVAYSVRTHLGHALSTPKSSMLAGAHGDRHRASPQQEAPVAHSFVEIRALTGGFAAAERSRSACPKCVCPECVPRRPCSGYSWLARSCEMGRAGTKIPSSKLPTRISWSRAYPAHRLGQCRMSSGPRNPTPPHPQAPLAPIPIQDRALCEAETGQICGRPPLGLRVCFVPFPPNATGECYPLVYARGQEGRQKRVSSRALCWQGDRRSGTGPPRGSARPPRPPRILHRTQLPMFTPTSARQRATCSHPAHRSWRKRRASAISVVDQVSRESGGGGRSAPHSFDCEERRGNRHTFGRAGWQAPEPAGLSLAHARLGALSFDSAVSAMPAAPISFRSALYRPDILRDTIRVASSPTPLPRVPPRVRPPPQLVRPRHVHALGLRHGAPGQPEPAADDDHPEGPRLEALRVPVRGRGQGGRLVMGRRCLFKIANCMIHSRITLEDGGGG